MSGLIKCAIYVAALGVVSFFLGRVIPESWFKYRAFPYRDYPFEKGGNVYRKLYIHRWHNHVPDMSRVFTNMMPPKKLHPGMTARELEIMVIETCVAEFTHFWLGIAGLGCLFLWPGIGGVLFYVAYMLLGNVPFILIQRYNRPRLIALLDKTRER